MSISNIPSLKVKGEEDDYAIGFLFLWERKKNQKENKRKRK